MSKLLILAEGRLTVFNTTLISSHFCGTLTFTRSVRGSCWSFHCLKLCSALFFLPTGRWSLLKGFAILMVIFNVLAITALLAFAFRGMALPPISEAPVGRYQACEVAGRSDGLGGLVIVLDTTTGIFWQAYLINDAEQPVIVRGPLSLK